METTKIDVNVKDVISNNRTPLSNFAGNVFAQDLFKPQVRIYDPDYQMKIEEVRNAGNKDLILNRSPRRFALKGITISAIEIGKNINDEVVLVVNKGLEDEIEIPYNCENSFGLTDDDIIKDAIKNPDKNHVFNDAKKLGAALNKLNAGEIQRIENLIKQLEAAKKSIENAISGNNEKISQYYNEKATSAQKTANNVSAEISVSLS